MSRSHPIPPGGKAASNPDGPGKSAEPGPSSPLSVIASGICLEGELVGQENLVVEGRVKGRIETQGDVVVASGAFVEAAILARSITIAGSVNGDIEARESVEIRQEGALIGDCRARSIQIREGARFEGRSYIVK